MNENNSFFDNVNERCKRIFKLLYYIILGLMAFLNVFNFYGDFNFLVKLLATIFLIIVYYALDISAYEVAISKFKPVHGKLHGCKNSFRHYVKRTGFALIGYLIITAVTVILFIIISRLS